MKGEALTNFIKDWMDLPQALGEIDEAGAADR